MIPGNEFNQKRSEKKHVAAQISNQQMQKVVAMGVRRRQHCWGGMKTCSSTPTTGTSHHARSHHRRMLKSVRNVKKAVSQSASLPAKDSCALNARSNNATAGGSCNKGTVLARSKRSCALQFRAATTQPHASYTDLPQNSVATSA